MSQSMKLVDILARELKVWPEHFGEFCISTIVEGSYAAWFNDRKPSRITSGGWSDIGCVELWISVLPDDHMFAIVTRDQWQTAVDTLRDAENVPLEWTGEGLPPVGTICEVYGCTHEYTERFNNQAVEIVAHHRGMAVFSADDDEYHGLVAHKFRPIRTAEQIADDERTAVIKEIAEFLGSIACDDWVAARELCDAGYRKQEE